MLWNATSVRHKLVELEIFLHNNIIDIALITETWLQADRIHIRDYSIVRKDRDSKGGGGVAILIHKSIQFEDIKQKHIPRMELATVTIKSNPQITVGAIYSPPITIYSRRSLALSLPTIKIS